MSKSFHSLGNQSGTVGVSQAEYPDVCPHCKRLVTFQFVAHANNQQTKYLEIVLRCLYPKCGGLVIASETTKNPLGYLVNINPPLMETIEVKESVKEISPNFDLIFRQAQEAKERGLDQIAGAGFRKACEFLIKDYAKSLITETDEAKKAEAETKIENAFVGQVVDKHINNPQVKKVAKRAFWIGNDETHYLRKWIDKDIEDLITLIKLTLNWIEIDQLSAQYEDDMPGS